jgi:hypothetical protein
LGPLESTILVNLTPGDTCDLWMVNLLAPDALVCPVACTARVHIVRKAAIASFPAPLRIAPIVRM